MEFTKGVNWMLWPARYFSACPVSPRRLISEPTLGNHTVYFTRHFSRVIAFEPNPMVAALLRVNTAEFGNAINVLQIGLSDAPAKLNFKVNEHNLGASRITDEDSNSVIEVDKLDNLVADLKLDDVSFVKIDVEGHEDRVIAGAFEFLSSCAGLSSLWKDFIERTLKWDNVFQDSWIA